MFDASRALVLVVLSLRLGTGVLLDAAGLAGLVSVLALELIEEETRA
jgi:hypothetical protein